MSDMVIELTNRCNLSCQHCFDDRHSAGGDLKVALIEKILKSARTYGIDHISFTGGEPTLHPEFREILKMVSEGGYKFGFVTNSWNFTEIYEHILPYRKNLSVITFSLDGAREDTHDRIRRKGSYRKVMKAVSICMLKEIPFTINTVMTSINRGELKEMAELAQKLGSRGLRFGYLIPTPHNKTQALELTHDEQKQGESVIKELQKTCSMPILMAPGHYTTTLLPCSVLQMKEFNIDWRGNLTLCCHLSGHGDDAGHYDVIGNLDEMPFSEAYELLIKVIKKFQKDKYEHHRRGGFRDSDYFPCWYCLNYFNKINGPEEFSLYS